MPEFIETAVLSDNVLLREGITQLLSGARFQVGHRASLAGFLKIHDAQKLPELFIVVIDEASCTIVGEIKKQFPDAKIVVLALHDSSELMSRAIQLGAVGYLAESLCAPDFIMSLEVVIANGAVFPPKLLLQLSEVPGEAPRHNEVHQCRADGTSFSGLSDREVGILEGLMLGESNKTIARRFQIAEATVKVHVKAILRKVRVKNRTQAAMWAMQKGTSLTSGMHMQEQASVEAGPEIMISPPHIMSLRQL